MLAAENFLRENSAESLNIVSKYSGVEKTLLSDIMHKQNFGVVLNSILPQYLNEEATWAKKTGLSSQRTTPNYLSLINPDYLREFKPAAVTI